MKRAFTIVELMVAVAVMAVVLTASGYIFKTVIDAQRTANATAEVMRNLRGITDQLNSDFAGIQTDAPLAIWFQQHTSDPNQRFDEIMFFAAGDFSSYRAEYGITTPPPPWTNVLKGNTARIWYGQGDTNDPQNKPPITVMRNPSGLRPQARVLARNQHILNPNPAYYGWPLPNFTNFAEQFNGRPRNDVNECDKLSLAQWKLITANQFQTYIAPNSLGDTVRPDIDSAAPDTYQNLMCKGVGSLAIQWGYQYINNTAVPPINEWRWWPSNDPDGNGDTSDSDFTPMNSGKSFGVYFNVDILNAVNFTDWFVAKNAMYDSGAGVKNKNFDGYFPQWPQKALKFTFKLYDSKGIIKGGRTFTHIVYLK